MKVVHMVFNYDCCVNIYPTRKELYEHLLAYHMKDPDLLVTFSKYSSSLNNLEKNVPNRTNQVGSINMSNKANQESFLNNQKESMPSTPEGSLKQQGENLPKRWKKRNKSKAKISSSESKQGSSTNCAQSASFLDQNRELFNKIGLGTSLNQQGKNMPSKTDQAGSLNGPGKNTPTNARPIRTLNHNGWYGLHEGSVNHPNKADQANSLIANGKIMSNNSKPASSLNHHERNVPKKSNQEASLNRQEGNKANPAISLNSLRGN